MNLFNTALKRNPLKTREDMEQALVDLLDPVYQLMALQETPGRFHISDSGSVYDEDRRDIEGFLRTLWGVGPLCSSFKNTQKYSHYFHQANRGILIGTDPDSDFYWGELHDYDQLFVEMGALATYLILTKEFFWDHCSEIEKKRIYHWLDQINHHVIPNTNWLFFRILVNTFFEKTTLGFSQEQIETDLAHIDTYYLADGWYFDGYEDQIDYYIPFGMQYYGLLFSKLTSDVTHPFVKTFQERGAIFAQTFKNWFSNTGAALPFGRSLTYRFAQSSFFAAAAFSGIDFVDFQASEAKYLILNNMRNWFQQPIFTSEGFLSIGYYYPNLVMAEGYNAPGSPYWSFKNFLLLALPETDPFWQLPEQVPDFPIQQKNTHSRMLLVHSHDGNELQAFTAGQHSHEHAHGDSKYEKFVYSTTFGFSVQKGNTLPKQGAYDNTLAISETTTHFKTAFGYEDYAIHDNYVFSKWVPYPDCVIKSFIIPCYPWHFRVHLVETNRSIHLIAGSFSAPLDGKTIQSASDKILYHSSAGTVGIQTFSPCLTCELTNPEPNTNLLFNRTVLPIVTTHLIPGKHLLLLSCLGNAGEVPIPDLDNVKLSQNKLIFTIYRKNLEVILEEL
ncbi:DUF2264 domain-containing protein [Enterococcus songbeiensis]|uniref:DUF2264 domain-containing protein n=1 Tax=Enterococcus songbeiensis TaxID=2559927 RepID=UPI0010F71E3C|nr:DUF2264 domain-containing protein [Enterococcus songbeiensis]